LGAGNFVWGDNRTKAPMATRLSPGQLSDDGALEIAHEIWDSNGQKQRIDGE